MSKDDAINIMKNSNLDNQSGLIKKILLYIKMGERTYYKKIEKQYWIEKKIVIKITKMY